MKQPARVSMDVELLPEIVSPASKRSDSHFWPQKDRPKWIFMLFCGCALLDITRVCMSLCIVDIAKELEWDKLETGLVLSSIFWGYFSTQLPAGFLSDTHGGDITILWSLFGCAVCTLAVPFVTTEAVVLYFAPSILLVLFSRVCLGFSQGFFFPSMYSLTGKKLPLSDRSMGSAIISSGGSVGALVVGSVGSLILTSFGWRWVFLSFGLISVVWVIIWKQFFLRPRPSIDDIAYNITKKFESKEHMHRYSMPKGRSTIIPWGKLIRQPAVWAIVIAHFSNNCMYLNLSSWLPTYFHETFPDAKRWIFNVVPYLCVFIGKIVGGRFADKMIQLGFCYFIPIFGGWIADKYTGRFNLILFCALIYFVGSLLLCVVSVEDKDFKKITNGSYLEPSYKTTYFIVALVFLAFGTGGIKANVCPLGADQVRDQGPRAIQRFFNWFYWFINIGCLFSLSLVVFVQQEYGFFYGYIITAGSLLLGIVGFFMSRNRYVMHPPVGSRLGDIFKVIWFAIKRTRKSERPIPRIKGDSWLDRAKESRGGHFTSNQVEDVKALLRVIPVFAMFIIYFILFFQMQTSFLIQAQYMKIHFGISFPAASLAVVFIIFALILIPFMDRVVYPFLHYIGLNFTPLRRIGVGMLFAASSFVVAGLVEIKRRDRYESGHFVEQTLFNLPLNASDLPIFYQIPQYLLIGTSEVFTCATGIEFAYSQAPQTSQGLVMGLFLITTGIGSYCASALENLVSWAQPRWYPEDNPNYGNLENYFFLLTVLMLVNFLFFLVIAHYYKYLDIAIKNEMPQGNDPTWDGNNTQERSQVNESLEV